MVGFTHARHSSESWNLIALKNKGDPSVRWDDEKEE
jgi:hypothetical protein